MLHGRRVRHRHRLGHHHHPRAMHPIITSFSGAKLGAAGESASAKFGEQAGGAHPTSFFHSQACIVHALPLLLLPLLLLSFAPVVSALINIRFMTPKTPFLGRQPDTRPGKKGGERQRAEQKAIGLLVGNTVELAIKLPSIGGLQDCNRR